jgi:ribosomal protein S21
MINVQVDKTASENTSSIIRRFTKKVQEAGILNRVRGIRYASRTESPYVRKKKTLKKLRRHEEVAKALKLGRPVLKKK